MRRAVAVLVAVLTGLAVAGPHATIFFPSDADLVAACKDGYQMSTASILNTYLGPLTEVGPAVQIQSPLGRVSSNCRTAALQHKPMPNPTKMLPFPMLAVRGVVEDLADAASLAAILVVQDKEGGEVHRLSPVESLIARTQDWRVECVDDCKWTGHNYFFFQMTPAVKATLEAGGKVSIIVQRGGISSRYEIPDALK